MCRARMLRTEVEVLSWSPDRGNPTSKRQGRGPELTGRLQCGCLRCGASVRAGLEEAIDALWSRTKVKRRKAFPRLGELAGSSDARFLPCTGGRSGDAIMANSQCFTPGDLLGSGELRR